MPCRRLPFQAKYAEKMEKIIIIQKQLARLSAKQETRQVLLKAHGSFKNDLIL